jgi:hypothetical protein
MREIAGVRKHTIPSVARNIGQSFENILKLLFQDNECALMSGGGQPSFHPGIDEDLVRTGLPCSWTDASPRAL